MNWWAFLRFVRDMTRDPLGTIKRRFETYGDLYFTRSQGDPLFVTRHPDHFHEVLVLKAGDFEKRSVDLGPFLGEGLLTANGEHWRRQRRLIQPGFRHERLQHYAQTMVEAADAMAHRWLKSPQRDVGRDMMALTLAVVGKALFNYETQEKVEDVARSMDALQRAVIAFDFFPRWVPTPLHLRTQRALKSLDRLIFELIEARRTVPDDVARQGDLLEHLLATDEMTTQQLRDELVTLFLAGYETTSLSLTWTWYLLAQNPDWERQLHAELDQVLGDRSPTVEDLDALNVTRRVLQESMRIFPPVYVVPRIAVRDTEIAGFAAPAGTEVVLWTYWAHHDPRWFPNPERFDPDRFLPNRDGVRHPHALLPFGAGSRTCIGRHFAEMEATLVLANLARRFRLEASDNHAPGVDPKITLGPKRPVRMRAIARTTA